MPLCPGCPTSMMVQALILDDRLWAQLLAITLALVAVALLATVAYGVNLRRREV